uniref:Uncharacterized protein n=1 Tax=Oryza meridionalis TaxID=40149 RepID=A0A0E0F6Q4_9ORYZ
MLFQMMHIEGGDEFGRGRWRLGAGGEAGSTTARSRGGRIHHHQAAGRPDPPPPDHGEGGTDLDAVDYAPGSLLSDHDAVLTMLLAPSSSI